jgi:transcriptional regulator with XRE-family HTH domain
MANNDFKKKLKIAMVDADINQKKLAKLLKTTQPQISKWLTGERNPKQSSLERIAKATKKPLNFFLENSNFASDNSSVMINEKNYDQMHKENELLQKEIQLLRRELEVERKEKELLKSSKKHEEKI